MQPNNNMNSFGSEKFKFVNQNLLADSDQIFGKYSNNLVNILKRYIKRPINIIASIIFLIFVLLAIIVPALNPTGYMTSLSSNEWASYLNPRIPGLGINGQYDTVMTQGQIDQFQNSPGFIVHIFGGQANQFLVRVNPYALPELKNLFPFFGTNSSGIDMWQSVWYGTAQSMRLAAIVSIATMLIGMVYGAIAGWFAGKMIDILLMRFVEILSSVPGILLIIVVAFALSGTESTVDNAALISTLVLISWTGPAALTRVYVIKYKDSDFVNAIRALGGGVPRILFYHILPSFIGRLIVQFVLSIPAVIFTEATLVFLGVKDPSSPSLGSLINDGSGLFLSQPFMLWTPLSVAIFLIVSTWFIAIGLNDAIDPRNVLKRG